VFAVHVDKNAERGMVLYDNINNFTNGFHGSLQADLRAGRWGDYITGALRGAGVHRGGWARANGGSRQGELPSPLSGRIKSEGLRPRVARFRREAAASLHPWLQSAAPIGARLAGAAAPLGGALTRGGGKGERQSRDGLWHKGGRGKGGERRGCGALRRDRAAEHAFDAGLRLRGRAHLRVRYEMMPPSPRQKQPPSLRWPWGRGCYRKSLIDRG
jgi:hypothetical protein